VVSEYFNTDYSPFGVQLSGRNFVKSGSREARFGFQGQEEDDEVKGDGNSYTTEFRQLDPRLGRWLSLDPLQAQTPWQSPYCSMDNNPICLNDLFGSSTDGDPVKKDGSSPENARDLNEVEVAVKRTAFQKLMGKCRTLNRQVRKSIVNLSNRGSSKSKSSSISTASSSKSSPLSSFDFVGTDNIYSGGMGRPGGPEEGAGKLARYMMNGLAAVVCAPAVIGTAVVAAPIVTSGTVATGVGLYKTGKFIFEGTTAALKLYHKTFGINGGWESLGSELLNQTTTQMVKDGKISPGKYDIMALSYSPFILKSTNRYIQGVLGASGAFITFSTSDGFGGALFEDKSASHTAMSIVLGVMPTLGGEACPSLFSETVTGLMQGVIDQYEENE